MRRLTTLATPLALLVLLPVFGPTAWAQTKITLWYPAGNITAGAAHFADKDLSAEFDKKNRSSPECVRTPA